MIKSISKNGIDLIKRYEGLRLKSYYCAAGVLTIGYGSTGKHVTTGLVITEKQAEALLIKDLARFEKGVRALVKPDINQNQFDSLVSFAFNCGLNNLASSTLLKRVNNNPQDKDIQNQFLRWNKAAGKVLAGLTRRRQEEASLYFK